MHCMYPAKPTLLRTSWAAMVSGTCWPWALAWRTVPVGKTVGLLLAGRTGVDVWGTLAEKVVVPTVDLVPVPQGWSLKRWPVLPWSSHRLGRP